ncbi:MAG: hypothetical protein IJ837_03405 [Clostridia bacterium]|nr:hypothetical protein [Clostridia bacterium]
MLRSIKKAFDIIKQNDPDTCVTVHTIRVWCKENKIKNLHAGTKILVDVESLLKYIEGGN